MPTERETRQPLGTRERHETSLCTPVPPHTVEECAAGGWDVHARCTPGAWMCASRRMHACRLGVCQEQKKQSPRPRAAPQTGAEGPAYIYSPTRQAAVQAVAPEYNSAVRPTRDRLWVTHCAPASPHPSRLCIRTTRVRHVNKTGQKHRKYFSTRAGRCAWPQPAYRLPRGAREYPHDDVCMRSGPTQ